MDDIKNVIVVGAGGNLGSYVIPALQAANFNITVLSRATSQSTFPDGIKVIKSEYTVPALKEALKGQDAVVSVVNPQGTLDQIPIIDAAEAVGVKRFIPSAFGNAPHQKGLPELEFARVTKRKILEHLRGKAEENPQFTWTAVATGIFFDWAIKTFQIPGMGFVKDTKTARIFDSGTKRITATTMNGIAQSVVGILRNPSATVNRHIRVRSVETTQNDILAAFERATGEKWTVINVSSQDIVDEGRRNLQNGDKRSGFLNLVSAQLFGEIGGSSIVASKEEADNALVGVQEEDVFDIVNNILED